VVFVEVKARRTRDAAAGAVSPAQWRRLGAAAERWLAEQATGAPDCRFDVVLVDGAGVAERVENAHSFDV
jgi:putative endonuclease